MSTLCEKLATQSHSREWPLTPTSDEARALVCDHQMKPDGRVFERGVWLDGRTHVVRPAAASGRATETPRSVRAAPSKPSLRPRCRRTDAHRCFRARPTSSSNFPRRTPRIPWDTSGIQEDLEAVVQAEGGLSEPFSVTSGVRQGCPLGPILFVIYFEAMTGSQRTLLASKSESRP